MRTLVPVVILVLVVGRMYALQQGLLLDKSSAEAKKLLYAIMDLLEQVSNCHATLSWTQLRLAYCLPSVPCAVRRTCRCSDLLNTTVDEGPIIVRRGDNQ